MLDFTSSLYLGLWHASYSLHPWKQLTVGKPAALAAPPGAVKVADRLARLIGCEQATLGPSTLHLFWDLFGLLSGDHIVIYVDAGAYPIARWGVERALARGALVRSFPHHDVVALRRVLAHDDAQGRRPFVVTDGFCPGCGHHAPLTAYLDSARRYGGKLIVDDTQALGIFGQPASDTPYGSGGGGSLHWCSLTDSNVLIISSLAKGFGVPLAVLAGSHAMIERFEQHSETRVHCSPPSIATIHAAEHALNVNDQCGDALRLRLAQNVRHFRTRLAERGLTTTGGLFPVQTLKLIATVDAIDFHERLLRRGIKTVLHHGHNGNRPRISFIVTVRHRLAEIDRAVNGVVSAIKMHSVGQALWR